MIKHLSIIFLIVELIFPLMAIAAPELKEHNDIFKNWAKNAGNMATIQFGQTFGGANYDSRR